jgi:ketosteroid isomerase-like protein
MALEARYHASALCCVLSILLAWTSHFRIGQGDVRTGAKGRYIEQEPTGGTQMSASALDRRTLLLGTSLIAAMGVSAKSLAMDASLPMKVADIDPAFEKAFNAGDLDALLKLYDDQSVLVAEPGKPVKGLENIKPALMGFLALKLPIQLTVRRVYENGDVGLCVADWSIVGKGPDGKDLKLGGTSAEVVRKTSGGNWVYVIDSPYGTA